MDKLLPKKNSCKVINAWCSYDIANSAYSLSIGTALYPIYYQEVTKQAFGSEMVNFMGFTLKNTVLYDYAIAAGYFIIIFLTPLLSGIADMGGYRKKFMQFFTIFGSLSCIGLYWFHGSNLTLGIILPATAVIGFAGSLVYYNSFLPVIASPDYQDKVSARGFIFGYAGSMLLLIISLFMIEKYPLFHFEGKLDALRFTFLMVGIWWFAIGQIAIYFLKEYPGTASFNAKILINGFREIAGVFKQVSKMPVMGGFLLAFFFFSMGVQTVILVASQFGSAELGITGFKLIITILIIQVVAIIGAWIFGMISACQGNKLSLMIMLAIWISICISAYYIQSEIQFFILSAMVGMVMGGIQSQARSTFSKLMPSETTDTASFFSFYDITEKVAIVIGMFGFGFITHITGSMRNSTLLLSVFFIASFIILSFTKLNVKKE
jgi:MFS transporter, UMF1 family